MPTVLLLRHGETDWNRERRVQGWAPVPLNERGREQARAAGRHIAADYDVDRVYASDLRRTRETAELAVAGGIDAEPTFDRAWRERHFGVYQGLLYDDVFGRHEDYDPAVAGIVGLEKRPEGGESLLEMHERVLDGWTALHEESGPDETVLVVTHGGPIYLVLGHAKGLDAAAAVSNHSQHNCAVNELKCEAAESVTVVRENYVDYAD